MRLCSSFFPSKKVFGGELNNSAENLFFKFETFSSGPDFMQLSAITSACFSAFCKNFVELLALENSSMTIYKKKTS